MKKTLLFVFLWLTISSRIFSQDSLKFDSMILKVTTIDNYDRPSSNKGFYDVYYETNELVYHYSDELNSFKSNELRKNRCLKTVSHDTTINHKDYLKIKKVSKVLSIDIVKDLISEAKNNLCCDSLVKNDQTTQRVICCDVDNNDFEINEKWLKRNIKRKAILKRAKFLDEEWRFKNSYSSREERLKPFRGYSNLDSLNLFLAESRSILGLMYSTGRMNRIWIDLIHEKDTIVSLFKIIGTSNQGIWLNKKSTKNLYNPRINLIAYNLLPKGSLFKNIIKREFIREKYIDWIINRYK